MTDHARHSPGMRHSRSTAAAIAVVLKGYPRLSETFIAEELRGLELRGLRLVLFSMRHPTDKKRHPVHDQIQAPVVYLPEYLYQEPLRVLKGLWRARRTPGYTRAWRTFLGDLLRDPTPNRVRRFGQAAVMAAELPDDVASLYAHFIHTPAAVTRYVHIMTGLTWSCSAHAKDIWTSPDWQLKTHLGSAAWVTTCTQVGADHLCRLAPSPDRVHLTYHGLDLTRFAAPAPRDETDLAARDGRSGSDPILILSGGRAVEKKGYDILLDALARLPDDLSWRFIHLGGGTLKDALKAKSSALGLTSRITWLGAQAQDEVLKAYRRADVFVLPCRIGSDGDRDGLPNVLVEAQSQRLACISTRVSAIPELIRDGETGVLVPPEDPDALAGALVRLARDPILRRTLGEAGERRVRAEFESSSGLDRLARLLMATRDASSRECAASAPPGQSPSVWSADPKTESTTEAGRSTRTESPTREIA
ncbi:MAG: glycosyltransferase [Hyphomicrobiaceae bacterium]